MIRSNGKALNSNLIGNDNELYLAEVNCIPWGQFDNRIEKIGNRVSVSFAVELINYTTKGGSVIIANVNSYQLPRSTYAPFSCTSNEGNALFGYVDKNTGRIIISSPNGNDKYVIGSFSYLADY